METLMPQGYPATIMAKLDEVRTTHVALKGRLEGKEWAMELERYNKITVAAGLGRKKAIMSERRLREMCEEYLSRYTPIPQ